MYSKRIEFLESSPVGVMISNEWDVNVKIRNEAADVMSEVPPMIAVRDTRLKELGVKRCVLRVWMVPST